MAPTIKAQSLDPSQAFDGPPQIPTIVFNNDTLCISNDLTTFITASTITQSILNDPNKVLRNANTGKNIIKTDVIAFRPYPAP
ncbi:hypothetical protein LTR53_007647 [Teratosphaeriaceae sp. CCFEE 6253]|nr:hypothetical protein LTR53_007647 [Teratosphaeriaceae sp. CCFEE 6253]